MYIPLKHIVNINHHNKYTLQYEVMIQLLHYF
jgi:hypothetical protein